MPFELRPFRMSGLASSLTVLLMLGACASSPPAPIVTRTTPAGTVARPPVAAPKALAAPAPAPVVVAPTPAPTVQAAPVRSATLEPRPLDTRPAEVEVRSGTDTRAPSGATSGAAPAPVVRTEPRGTKVPYSDSALADMRSAETPAVSGAAAPAAAAAASAATRPVEPARATEPSGPVEWGWPVNGKVVQGFAESSKGISLGGTAGDPVAAAADGRVIFSGNGPRGYGNLVIVKHANDLLSVYAHNRTLSVKEGQTVKRGQKIAELGDSAGSPRLHFEIRQQGKPVDPTTILPRR